MLKHIISLIRIKHWVKNALIFLPAFFGGVIHEVKNIELLFVTFLYFSLSASLVYIVNDLIDINKDKLHPQKKNRALASGAISKKGAFILMGVVLSIVCAASFYLPIKVVYVTSIYLVLNLMYSLYLKTIPILELFIIALGFVFRILIGGFTVEVAPSKWIIMLTFFAALYIILSKRRGEILNKEALNTRKVLSAYTEAYLTHAMVIVLSVSILSYIMYTVEPSVIKQFSTDKIYMTSIFVILALLRHLQQTLVYNNTESPVKYLFKDKLMLVIILMWFINYYILIYSI